MELNRTEFLLCTETNSQRASKTQVYHTLHQEDSLSDRADWPLPPLEIRGTRGGVQLWRLGHVSLKNITLICINNQGVSVRGMFTRPFNLLPLSVPASFRDADGDVDQCPMWTFPTVRPTSMNKLQKGYTHTDSEVRQTEQRDGNTRSNLFSFHLTLCFLFAVRRFCEKATKVTVLVCFGNTHLQRGRPYCCFLYNLRFI